MSTNPPTNELNSDAELDEIFSTLNGSGSHACYCPRSVDGGCECALKDEYLDESKAKLLAWRDRCVAEAEKTARIDGVRTGIMRATGSCSYTMPIKSVRTSNTAFKKYAVKFFNTKIRERREALLLQLQNEQLTQTEPTHE